MAIFLHDNTHTQNLHPSTTADFWDKLHTIQICRGETRKVIAKKDFTANRQTAFTKWQTFNKTVYDPYIE